MASTREKKIITLAFRYIQPWFLKKREAHTEKREQAIIKDDRREWDGRDGGHLIYILFYTRIWLIDLLENAHLENCGRNRVNHGWLGLAAKLISN